MKLTPVILSILTAMVVNSQAGTSTPMQSSVPTAAPTSSSPYRAGEFQFDLIGAYGMAESDHDRDAFGGGLGFNYYFTPYFGIGGEGMLFDTSGDTYGSTSFNLFVRAPLGNSRFALYGFGGAGVVINADKLESGDFRDARDRLRGDDDANTTDNVVFEAHVGAGVECRMTDHLGLFTDVRYTFVDLDNSDFISARVGLRFNF